MPLELLLEVQTIQVLVSKCGTDTDDMARAMNKADVVRINLQSSDVAEKAIFDAKVNDAVQHIGVVFDAATVSEWQGLEDSQEESILRKLVQPPEVYNPVLEKWDEDELTKIFLSTEDHMTTIGVNYRGLNTKLTQYTAKREAAKLPETPELGKFKEFMTTIATYVGITVVLEALFITSPRDQQQAITDLKGYKQEFESQKMQIPAALVCKVDEVLLGN